MPYTTKQKAKWARTMKARAAQQKGGWKVTAGYARRQLTPAGELKFFDTTDTFATVLSAGEIKNSLNLIPQGVTESERVGRKCTISSLFLQGDITLNQVTGSASPFVDRIRLIVYLDKQANGATAAVTDILETADILSFRNLSNSGRFRVLRDHQVSLSAVAGAGDTAGTDSNWGGVIKSWKVSLPNLNIPVEFSSTTGAITELRSNNIGILAIAETNIASSVKYNARVRFRDG